MYNITTIERDELRSFVRIAQGRYLFAGLLDVLGQVVDGLLEILGDRILQAPGRLVQVLVNFVRLLFEDLLKLLDVALQRFDLLLGPGNVRVDVFEGVLHLALEGGPVLLDRWVLLLDLIDGTRWVNSVFLTKFTAWLSTRLVHPQSPLYFIDDTLRRRGKNCLAI